MSLISIIHPTKSRPSKSRETLKRWINDAIDLDALEVIISLDENDPDLSEYEKIYSRNHFHGVYIVNSNKSSIEAVNQASKVCRGDILLVVSDDTDSVYNWDLHLRGETNGKTDWILKTKDGIQDYIITMPIMDRAYYNRTGYIYHPEFQHLFCDTYLTCVADITGRKITSNLMFKHDHYSVNGTEPDDLHKRNDATWKQGQETFIRLMKQFTPQERARIKDPGMRSWLRNHGV